MSSQPIISVSGLRGIVGESLTPELVVRYISAFATELPAGDFVVAYDGRATGPAVVAAVSAALTAAGRSVHSAGVAATPTVGILVREGKFAGGVQVSASHNPAEYNGLKLFGGDGRVLPADAGQRVKDRYLSSEPEWVGHSRVGRLQSIPDTVTPHVDLIAPLVDVDRIRQSKYRVLLDANHGSGSVVAERLLELLSCSVTFLGGTPDGQFAHLPEPTADNLVDVCDEVTRSNSIVGFCQDPDADRLALVDEQGRYIGEEKTLAICVDHVLRQSPGAVVTNCSTSRMTQDVAIRHGVPFYHAAVGEANVVDEMLARKAVVGGEGNGGVIHPRVGLVRDSFVGMALVLDAMSARDLPLSALADELPQYAIHKSKVTLAPQHVPAALDRLEKSMPEATPSRLDGLRLDWPDEKQWLLVRASNTEPIVRIFAEAPQAADARQLCAAAERLLSQDS